MRFVILCPRNRNLLSLGLCKGLDLTTKKSSGTSNSSEKYCSKTGDGHNRRVSTTDKHKARSRSRSRSPLLRKSSDGRCDSRVPLSDSASRVDERSSSHSRGESMRRSSGLGRASPSVIRTESRPVGPVASDENELLESVEQAPQWAKYMIALQQQSEQRLQNLESAVKKAGSTYVSTNQDKMVNKFTNKLYEDQYDFNMSLYRTLENAVQMEDKEERDAHLLAGTEVAEKRNKILILSDKHGWECAEAYVHNPLADNSDDKKIKKALKEVKSVKEEKLKAQRISRKSSSISNKAFQNHAVLQIPVVQSTQSTTLYCRRCGRQGHYAKYCRAGLPSDGFPKGQFPNQSVAGTIPNQEVLYGPA